MNLCISGLNGIYRIIVDLLNNNNQSSSTHQQQPSSEDVKLASEYRQQADALFKEANLHSKQSQQYYHSGDKEAAKNSSNLKNKLIIQAESLNSKAKFITFNNNNYSRDLDTIDLHGLFVQEALELTQERIQSCKLQNIASLCIITGRGNHSDNNIAKIKPKIIEYLETNGYMYEVDVPNEGCVTMNFSQNHQPRGQEPPSLPKCIIL